jgi:hypothetical protein
LAYFNVLSPCKFFLSSFQFVPLQKKVMVLNLNLGQLPLDNSSQLIASSIMLRKRKRKHTQKSAVVLYMTLIANKIIMVMNRHII